MTSVGAATNSPGVYDRHAWNGSVPTPITMHCVPTRLRTRHAIGVDWHRHMLDEHVPGWSTMRTRRTRRRCLRATSAWPRSNVWNCSACPFCGRERRLFSDCSHGETVQMPATNRTAATSGLLHFPLSKVWPGLPVTGRNRWMQGRSFSICDANGLVLLYHRHSREDWRTSRLWKKFTRTRKERVRPSTSRSEPLQTCRRRHHPWLRLAGVQGNCLRTA